MNILFENAAQVAIADLLWAAQTQEEVDVVIRVFGPQAVVVQNMLVAAALDEVTEVDQAKEILEALK